MTVAVRRLGMELDILSDYVGRISFEKINRNASGGGSGGGSSKKQRDIRISFSFGGLDITIYIDNRFPFACPYNICVNNMCYENLLKNNVACFKDIISEYGYPSCFCCVSVTCSDKWGPNIHLKDIVDEIKDVIDKKQHVMYVYFCRQIACERLTYDVPLELYL